jgi:hypothetical protein
MAQRLRSSVGSRGRASSTTSHRLGKIPQRFRYCWESDGNLGSVAPFAACKTTHCRFAIPPLRMIRIYFYFGNGKYWLSLEPRWQDSRIGAECERASLSVLQRPANGNRPLR